LSTGGARKALNIATRHLERVQTAWWEPADAVEAVTFAFYAYENAIVAIAELNGRRWTKNHYEKAELAHQLSEEGLLTTDVSDRLREFNDLRKDVAYDEPGPELAQLDLEGVATELERFIDEVTALVEAREAEETK
jgi:hypothetical protein